MPKPTGRPNGHLLHAEAFEAIVAARGLLKKQVAENADLSPSFLADLLAHRSGAAPAVADRLAGSLGVRTSALFPELAGWIGPLPDRNGKRSKAAA